MHPMDSNSSLFVPPNGAVRCSVKDLPFLVESLFPAIGKIHVVYRVEESNKTVSWWLRTEHYILWFKLGPQGRWENILPFTRGKYAT